MSGPDPAFAEWLQSASKLTSAEDAAVAAAFGGDARESSAMSPYALKADADAEAARSLAFVKAPHVEEVVQVSGTGIVAARRGRCVTITASAPGYTGGALCFVLGGDEDRASGNTVLQVLRRL